LIRLAESDRSDIKSEYLDWNFKTFLGYIPQSLKNESDLHVYVINNYLRDWGHQMIHSESTLRRMLEYLGFAEITCKRVGDSLDPELRDLEQHAKMITDRFNEYETIVVEASKPEKRSNSNAVQE
jgi:hypothetical protein